MGLLHSKMTIIFNYYLYIYDTIPYNQHYKQFYNQPKKYKKIKRKKGPVVMGA